MDSEEYLLIRVEELADQIDRLVIATEMMKMRIENLERRLEDDESTNRLN